MSGTLTYDQNLLDKFSKFTGELQQELQGVFGYMSTALRYAVTIGDSAIRQRIQGELNHAVGLFSVAHLMGRFEKVLPKAYWHEVVVDANDLERILAYRHISLSGHKGFSGDRVNEDRASFDSVMAGPNPILGVESFTTQKIVLTENFGIHAHQFLYPLSNMILAEIAKKI
ncbi:hypothetical protein [Psychroserpens sp.]|uniref:hypothetical protein n=1 Tax=Psychroserpens sp. TaxID=2020870 RepID=UPI001B1BC500|nr:hypothetical protein [Psychroserpens sp.]MBO6607402.1 hypothetical protein [Psychroserpens sp.]MBO6654520.1 hypothetical protein [Psychroserpens sp.]MBO6681131.1 hypothetical protein [Psychroserpens sp.]MBO6749912.1 hypothetical protein [Psychroserpens sp.]MBO6916100.1 hypothetical protein [Psychroserpens sp.]